MGMEMQSPEDIARFVKEREASDKELEVGGAVEVGDRIEVTAEQFEAAQKEMEEDLDGRGKEEERSSEDVKQATDEKISQLENVLGQQISDESKQKIHENEVEGVEKKQTGEDKNNSQSSSDAKPDFRLEQEAKDLENKHLEKKKSAEAVKETLRSGEFVDSVKKVAAVLKEREANAFNPLIDPRAISYLTSGAQQLEAAIMNKNSSLEDINMSIRKIGGAIRSIGEVPRQARVKDNPESLSRVGFALRNLDDTGNQLRLRIGRLDDPNTAQSLQYLRVLGNITQDKWLHVARKRSQLEGR